MRIGLKTHLALLGLLTGTGLAQTVTPRVADADGRATPQQRESAAIGAPVPRLPDADAISPEQQASRRAGWHAEIRKQLFLPSVLPKLEPRTWSTFSPTPGVLADRVTYATADGLLVPAIIYRPDPAVVHWKGKLPGVVIVNGHGGDKFSWYAFYSGMLFAKAGAMVVTYDPIGEGERNFEKASRAGVHDTWVSPPPGLPRTDWGQRLAGLMQVDVMQAVSYLDSRSEVDPTVSRWPATLWAVSSSVLPGPSTRVFTPCWSAAGVSTTALGDTSIAIHCPARCPPTKHFCLSGIVAPCSMRSMPNAARCSS